MGFHQPCALQASAWQRATLCLACFMVGCHSIVHAPGGHLFAFVRVSVVHARAVDTKRCPSVVCHGQMLFACLAERKKGGGGRGKHHKAREDSSVSVLLEAGGFHQNERGHPHHSSQAHFENSSHSSFLGMWTTTAPLLLPCSFLFAPPSSVKFQAQILIRHPSPKRGNLNYKMAGGGGTMQNSGGMLFLEKKTKTKKHFADGMLCSSTCNGRFALLMPALYLTNSLQHVSSLPGSLLGGVHSMPTFHGKQPPSGVLPKAPERNGCLGSLHFNFHTVPVFSVPP